MKILSFSPGSESSPQLTFSIEIEGGQRYDFPAVLEGELEEIYQLLGEALSIVFERIPADTKSEILGKLRQSTVFLGMDMKIVPRSEVSPII